MIIKSIILDWFVELSCFRCLFSKLNKCILDVKALSKKQYNEKQFTYDELFIGLVLQLKLSTDISIGIIIGQLKSYAQFVVFFYFFFHFTGLIWNRIVAVVLPAFMVLFVIVTGLSLYLCKNKTKKLKKPIQV